MRINKDKKHKVQISKVVIEENQLLRSRKLQTEEKHLTNQFKNYQLKVFKWITKMIKILIKPKGIGTVILDRSKTFWTCNLKF